MQITLDPPAKVPTGAQFLTESRDYFTGQKAKVLRTRGPTRVRGGAGDLEHFTMDVQAKDERMLMDYYVARQNNGGATLAARLRPGAESAAVQKEVERIARSLTITKAIK